MALAFADSGADVAINYITHEPSAQELVQKIEGKGRRSLALKADVSDEAQVTSMFNTLDEAWGGVDVLLDNAGIDGKPMLSWEGGTPDFKRVLEINLFGAYVCARQALQRMVRQKRGVILFTSSVHQMIAWSGRSAYTASKAGVEMMMKTMAQEAGPFNVRVLAIAPGALATPINAAVLGNKAWEADLLSKVCLKRIGQPAEVAALAVFLASDQAGYITGTTIFIDGGMTDFPAFAQGG
jgi:NAD(P)-dependent dehydrogenase (short-subunit alcohol dehydrogenase family)